MNKTNIALTLADAEIGKEYIITHINVDDDELKSFLFTLGCYEDEQIVVVSHMSRGYVISVKDGRYTIDHHLATAISIQP